MKTLALLVIVLTICVLIIPSVQNAIAMPYNSPLDLYKQSDMVFYGQVVTIGPGPGPNSNYYLLKVFTNFKNSQTSGYMTIESNKTGNGIHYPQFEAGDNAIFYIQKINGINNISPYSQKAGGACDIHSFLGPAPIPGEPIMRGGYASRIYITDSGGNSPEKFPVNNRVVLSYDDIWNIHPEARTIPIETSILDSHENMVFYKKQGMGLRACDGPVTMLWDFVPTQSGKYTATVVVDNKTTISTSFDVNGSNVNSVQLILSPLKQFKSGIKAEDVKCNTGFQLILKGSDNSPACIKKSDVSDFIQRVWAIRTIKVENTDLSLDYIIIGGLLEQANADIQSKSLVLSVKASENGTLVANLPRSLIDPKMDGQDSEFIVLTDGQEGLYKQTMTTATERVLSIQFTNGTSKIEIIAPEPIP